MMEVRIRDLRVRHYKINSHLPQKWSAIVKNSQVISAGAVAKEDTSIEVERGNGWTRTFDPSLHGEVLQLKIGRIADERRISVSIKNDCLPHATLTVSRIPQQDSVVAAACVQSISFCPPPTDHTRRWRCAWR